MASTPLFGLLLVGGKSSRMGEDKASLVYREETPEWKRLHSLLSSLCDAVLLCHRGDQDFGVPAVIAPGDGVLKAIHAAQQAYPMAAFLTLACDLPLLEKDTLEHLITERDVEADATFFTSSIDLLPEPLCCIYEPSIAPTISTAISQNTLKPGTILKTTNTKAVSLKNPHSLLNANTKADVVEIHHILNNTQTEKTLSLQYFAQLRDITKKDAEEFTTSSTTASGVYEELRSQYAFPYKQKELMLAINDDFAEWEQELKTGDNLVFIPPVAGG